MLAGPGARVGKLKNNDPLNLLPLIPDLPKMPENKGAILIRVLLTLLE
jgi:hypothetical protein